MKNGIVSFVVGVLFAIGLGIGGMTQPQKVVAFLDVTGAWDPSLAFVMGGAVAVTFFFFRFALRRPAPVFGERFSLPSKRDVDAPLLVGSALFGIGWGIGGICPGPGLTAVASGEPSFLIFVASMIGGMALFRLWERVVERERTAPGILRRSRT